MNAERQQTRPTNGKLQFCLLAPCKTCWSFGNCNHLMETSGLHTQQTGDSDKREGAS